MKEANCGFGKWSISIDLKNTLLCIKHGNDPNYGELKLGDLCGEDLSKLTNLFLDALEEVRGIKRKEK